MKQIERRKLLLTVLMIALAVIVIVASVIYLGTDKMIPGLIPMGSAGIMVLMILQWRRDENGKLYAILFAIAGILNLISAVMQIWAAL